MFIVKKIVTQFFMPIPFVLQLLIIGTALLWFTRRQVAAKIVLTTATILLFGMGFGFLSDHALYKLENTYPPLDIEAAQQAGIRWVVVLAGGHSSDAGLPVTSQLMPETQVRLNEGIRIYRQLNGAKLLLSGGKVFDPKSSAELMAGLARELGVKPGDIVLEDTSKDTDDEARLIKPMLGDQRFILVTSASHMPRSMALFTARGMQPVPAPVCHYFHREDTITPGDFFPRLDKIRNCQIVIHETLGLLAAEIKEAF